MISKLSTKMHVLVSIHVMYKKIFTHTNYIYIYIYIYIHIVLSSSEIKERL